MNYLSGNIVYLSSAEKKAVLNIVKSDRIDKIISGQTDLSILRLTPNTKDMFTRAIELNNLTKKFASVNRRIKLFFKGAKDVYLLSRYLINSGCSGDCPFKAQDEKEVDFTKGYIEDLEISPYSVQLLVFKKKPLPPPVEAKPEVSVSEEPVKNAENK
jgi:hypothetical protein